jgi:glutaredoxin
MKTTLGKHLGLLALLLLAHSAVWAQVIYRSVDQNGHVSYSDQPPILPAPRLSNIKDGAVSAGDETRVALPYALTQVMAQFPVTLYSNPQCGGACISARALLVKRGVPFTESTITTQQDADALKRIGGENGPPLITIGGQHLRGYSEGELTQYLDAAGYPSSSLLPPSYRFAAATPLAPAPAAPQTQAGNTEPTAATPPAPSRTPDNPAGIQF